MINVPNNFQFRLEGEPGYTHSGKIENGVCKVTWARGFERYYMDKTGTTIFPDTEWSVQESADQFVNRRWFLVVDDKKAEQKKQEEALPDVFYFKVLGSGPTYRMALVNGVYRCTFKDSDYPPHTGAPHSVDSVKVSIKTGAWKVVNTITSEQQQRDNKRIREEIAALEQSVAYNQQGIEHRQRLIASYEDRKNDLLKKIIKED